MQEKLSEIINNVGNVYLFQMEIFHIFQLVNKDLIENPFRIIVIAEIIHMFVWSAQIQTHLPTRRAQSRPMPDKGQASKPMF